MKVPVQERKAEKAWRIGSPRCLRKHEDAGRGKEHGERPSTPREPGFWAVFEGNRVFRGFQSELDTNKEVEDLEHPDHHGVFQQASHGAAKGQALVLSWLNSGLSSCAVDVSLELLTGLSCPPLEHATQAPPRATSQLCPTHL